MMEQVVILLGPGVGSMTEQEGGFWKDSALCSCCWKDRKYLEEGGRWGPP